MERHKPYEHVISDIKDWPIYKLYQDRPQFVEEIVSHTLAKYESKSTEEITNIIARAIYLERIRIKEDPWKVDPSDEMDFFNWVRKGLLSKSLDRSDAEAKQEALKILERMVRRYAEEIAGGFKISTFLFARKFLTAFFSRLLNAAAGKRIHRLWGSKYRLYNRMRVYGEVHAIRNLITKGTVVLVPTHFSNLDSILIGYALDSIVGVPAFSYGAGLNLYNTGYTAYFMNRLGAYRVDRRKKNTIYLETLKTMSELSIERGTNTLFFPGGTRSRSGSLEKKLKMGLLGTALEAQRQSYLKNKDQKIFIVPLVLSYDFVLEAESLVEQYLRQTGEERYLKNTRDESYSVRKIVKFIWQLFSKKSDITLSFGKPMDVLGNFVDDDGKSHDKKGREINVSEYFMLNDQLNIDYQRETEYTKRLADIIVQRYFKENIVLPSHLVSYVAFQILCLQNSKLDLFGILRLPPEDYAIPLKTFCEAVNGVRDHLFRMESEGELKLSEAMQWDIESLVKEGISNLGIYHSKEPLKYNEQGDVISEDFRVLYFYHNRLEGYELERYVSLDKYEFSYIEK